MKLAYAKYSEITNLTLFFIYIENIFKKFARFLEKSCGLSKKCLYFRFGISIQQTYNNRLTSGKHI